MVITTPSYLWLMDENGGTRYATLGGVNFNVDYLDPSYPDGNVEGRVGMATNWWAKWPWFWGRKGHELRTASDIPPVQGSFSVSFWCQLGKPAGSENVVSLFQQRDDYASNSSSNSFKIGVSVYLYLQTIGAGGAVDNLAMTTTSSYMNKWTHYVFSYNTADKDKRIYVNGVLKSQATATHSNALLATTAYKFSLCNSRRDYYAPPCGFQQIAFWRDYVITEPEITQLYNNSAGLAYPFFDGKAFQYRS